MDTSQLINSAKAIIFDMDGVIIDSIPLYRKSKYIFLEKYGIGREQTKQFDTHGMGTKDIMQLYKDNIGLQGDVDELTSEWRDALYKLLLVPGNITLLEGAEVLIKYLHGKKPLTIATGGHKKEMAKQLLELFGLRKYFSEIISSDDVEKGKPAPDVYLFTAKKLGIDPKDCLVFEDAANGTIAAKRAGMKVIGVNQDEKHRKALQKAGADIIVSSLSELV